MTTVPATVDMAMTEAVTVAAGAAEATTESARETPAMCVNVTHGEAMAADTWVGMMTCATPLRTEVPLEVAILTEACPLVCTETREAALTPDMTPMPGKDVYSWYILLYVVGVYPVSQRAWLCP